MEEQRLLATTNGYSGETGGYKIWRPKDSP